MTHAVLQVQRSTYLELFVFSCPADSFPAALLTDRLCLFTEHPSVCSGIYTTLRQGCEQLTPVHQYR